MLELDISFLLPSRAAKTLDRSPVYADYFFDSCMIFHVGQRVSNREDVPFSGSNKV